MDVIVTGFEGERPWETAVGGLQRVFELDFETATSVVRRVPAAVKRNAPVALAERYARALESIGARVELRTSTPPPPMEQPPARVPSWWNELPGLDDEPPAPPADVAEANARLELFEPPMPPRRRRLAVPPPPRLPLVPPNPVPQPVEETDERSFWAALPSALVMPLRGAGMHWLAWCLGYGLVFGVISLFTRGLGIVGIAIGLVFGSVMVGLLAGYFRSCLWSALQSEPEPGGMSELGPDSILDDYVVPGLVLTFFLMTTQLAFMAWLVDAIRDGRPFVAVVLDPRGWALLVIPTLYWPIGLALRALEGSSVAFFDVVRAVKLAVRAPLELATTVVVGLVAFLVPWIATSVAALASNPILALVLAPFLITLPLAYSHGVQGALFGHLLRNRPELGL